jgi:hypothetical protein
MILFKEFYSKTENATTFLPKEPVVIRDIGKYIAKVDTGNDAYNALINDEKDLDLQSNYMHYSKKNLNNDCVYG